MISLNKNNSLNFLKQCQPPKRTQIENETKPT